MKATPGPCPDLGKMATGADDGDNSNYSNQIFVARARTHGRMGEREELADGGICAREHFFQTPTRRRVTYMFTDA